MSTNPSFSPAHTAQRTALPRDKSAMPARRQDGPGFAQLLQDVATPRGAEPPRCEERPAEKPAARHERAAPREEADEPGASHEKTARESPPEGTVPAPNPAPNPASIAAPAPALPPPPSLPNGAAGAPLLPGATAGEGDGQSATAATPDAAALALPGTLPAGLPASPATGGQPALGAEAVGGSPAAAPPMLPNPMPTPPPLTAATPAAGMQAASVPIRPEALPMAIAAAAEGGTKVLTIRLDPAELGGVSIRIELGEDGLRRAHLIVERAATLHQLLADAPRLEQALATQQNGTGGTGQNGASLSFSLASDHPGQEQAHQQAAKDPQPADDHDAAVADPPSAAGWRALPSAAARLDVIA